jgi:hypothetical protein
MDQRSGLDGDVYGSRVSPRGNVLEEAGLRLTRSSGYVEKHPALAFDGTNYLLVWEHQRDPYPGNVDILGVLVNSTGEVLREMQISSGQRPGARPVVAFDGTNFLVVWGRGVGCAEICGARVSRSGSVLDAGGIPISGLDYASNPAVAFDGTNYLVVWNGSGPEITFTRVTPTGNVLEPGGIPIGRGSSPAVALAGGNYLVAWLNSGYDYDVRGTRVSPSGTVLDPVAIRISRGALPEVPSVAPAVAFDGTNALVVWSDRGIFGARVNSAGTVLDPRGILIATSPHRCVVPRVVGLRLARAKARIPSANCRLGLLGRVRSTRPGRVLAQRPYAGARRPRGTPVNLLVGVRRR